MPPESNPQALEWEQIKALFDQAMALDPDQREEFVASAGASLSVRAEVLSLLAHAQQATDGGGGFLGQPAAASVLGEPDDEHAHAAVDRTGQRLGAWEIVRTLGSGGMGDVFEARRADGSFDGQAAIKLLKRGMDSAAVLQRFAQGRQALARLHHLLLPTPF